MRLGIRLHLRPQNTPEPTTGSNPNSHKPNNRELKHLRKPPRSIRPRMRRRELTASPANRVLLHKKPPSSLSLRTLRTASRRAQTARRPSPCVPKRPSRSCVCRMMACRSSRRDVQRNRLQIRALSDNRHTQHPRQRPRGNSQARVKSGDATGESANYRPRSLNTAQCGGNSPRIR